MCIVSAIVPIYNVEQYLSMCVHSIMQQTLKDIEIILIDDGSTDRSGKLADYFQQQDSRIKVIHQENKGLSAARNVGLDMAQGTYIAFVDSDDWIVKNAFEKLVLTAEAVDADMVMGEMLFRYESGRSKVKFKKKNIENFNLPLKGSDCFVKLQAIESYAPMACNYLYKRKFIEKHHFRFALTIHEDELWTLTLMCLADRVLVIDFIFYVYRQREGSILHSVMHEKRCGALIFVANELFTFASQYDFCNYRELKSWIFVKVYSLYFSAYKLLHLIENREYVLNNNFLDEYKNIVHELSEKQKKICYSLYMESKNKLNLWESNKRSKS